MRLSPTRSCRWVFIVIGLFAGLATERSTCAQSKGAVEKTTVAARRDGSWFKVHESFLKRKQEGKIDLLFLGDSITQGWGYSAEAKAIWDKYYGSRNAANFGIGGDRTQHVLWRLENGEIDGIKPKVVVLMIGTNNLGSDTPAEIADGVTEIVKMLRQKLPESKILLLAVFPRSQKPDSVRERLKAVNGRIEKLGDDKIIKYIDIGPKFLQDDGTISKEIMPDFLHLSGKGYTLWAEAIEPTLKEMLGEG